MKQSKYLFIDRDGTVIVEPQDKQIDCIEKLEFLPGVFDALSDFQQAGFKLVMVSNQDGLGTKAFPENDFKAPHVLMLRIFASQKIHFHDILICPHFEDDCCDCRKPKVGLLMPYLREQVINRDHSYVIGDRLTDIKLAQNLGITGIQIGGGQFKSWAGIKNYILNKPRQANISRTTHETDIRVYVNLDDADHIKIQTGIGFFDHMLEQVAKHAGISMEVIAKGDLHIDDHHTVEDIAITLGQAMSKALADKTGIKRYGFLLPMDEACAEIALDLSGRFYCLFEANFTQARVGDLSTELVSHFFYSFAESLKATLHIKLKGDNTHHMIEAAFKALGKVLKQAIVRDSLKMPSTKGVL
ncbi:bifunctional histidinol-phosphatase/imidazoleglycerol-phosphate dehydratase HisB [Facilibium subflavum]|uniref:bifunctional histidinol-phosphatase/imidazoleglycerol-phosphate dehydratase HisB n=1 Tax=Facilibium subflavum TaxID=2219058 RepID=UPI000E6523D5|nr:bifunctional histidinol-phosphatase/imidazoleglycerol-phosphate dehydratase HisB [Facilibium subflavum]